MLSLAHRRDISAIIVEKVDRLTRSIKHAVTVNEWIDGDPKRQVHFVKQGCILCKESPSAEKLLWNMQVLFAQHYIDNLSEEVKKGQKEKIAQGWLPTKPPLGYVTIGDAGHKIHVPNPDVAPLIRSMFESYATGNYSLTQLVEKMYRAGLWTRNKNKLVKSRMASLLKDPFYCGTIRWKGAYYEGKHEPLISRELFDVVQKIKSKRTNKKYVKHNFLFKGLLHCIDCGGKITWEEHKRIVYGHCNRYRNCTQKTWHKEKDIDEKIIERLKLLQRSTTISKRIKDSIEQYEIFTVEGYVDVDKKRRLLKNIIGKILLGDIFFELAFKRV